MSAFSRLGRFFAVMLIGIGVAVFVRTMLEVGTQHFALGHVVGPGLVGAGIVRLKLQRMLDRDADAGEGGDRGEAP